MAPAGVHTECEFQAIEENFEEVQKVSSSKVRDLVTNLGNSRELTRPAKAVIEIGARNLDTLFHVKTYKVGNPFRAKVSKKMSSQKSI